MNYKGRLKRFRSYFRHYRLDALLVTHLPNIRYLCGFTGSAGALLVSRNKCEFFTDGRYREQADDEVQGARVIIASKPPVLAAAERLAADGGPTAGKILRPSDGKEAKRVALIQCAGSRDLNHLPYCSRICCLASLKHAAYVRAQYASAQVDIYYIDIRAHDKLESFYQKVKADPQVRFVKSKPASIYEGEGGNPVLHGEDTLSRELYDRDYDLVVLATGMEPESGSLPGSIRDQTDEYGFLAPPDGAGGMCAAGVASGPLDVSMSVQSATAAALKAIQTAQGGQA